MLGFNVGLSALRSSQTAMDVIANNIANTNTPGYHRQIALQVQNAPTYDGNFWRGTGASISRINQVASRAIESALTNNISDSNRVDASLQIARQVESTLASSEGSLHQRIDAFFAELQQLQAKPESGTQRRIVANQSQALAQEIRSVDNSLRQLQTSTRQEVDLEIANVNLQLETLANLNDQISRAQSLGQNPNSLLDNHQQLVNQIAESIDIEVIPRDVGFTYQFAEGHVSITHSTFSLAADHHPDGTVSYRNANGGSPLELGGGRLASHQNTLNTLIPGNQNRLDQFASSLIQSVNQIHATGVSGSGPFTQLSSTNAVIDIGEVLASGELPFDISSGSLFVSVHDTVAGTRVQHEVSIDPASQTLAQVANAISDIPNIQAVADTETGGISIVATPGFQFDFAGQLPTQPDRTLINGDAAIGFDGNYSGDSNQQLNFQIQGTGTVGVDDSLNLVVFNSNGDSLGSYNIGQGYEPGSDIDIGDGISLSIESGTLEDGDSFSVVAVNNSDTSGILASLGLNSFFDGSDAGNIAIASSIIDNPDLIATGRSPAAGDGSNISRLLNLRNSPVLSRGNSTFEQHLDSMVTDIAITVSDLTASKSDLGALQNSLHQERESFSGVDPNEEMIQLLTYQRAFQAATRIITTMDETLSELMNIIR